MAFSVAKRTSIYIHDTKISGFTIYDISKLRANNCISYPIPRLPTGKDSTDDRETLTTGNDHQVRMPSVSQSADETQAFAFLSMLTCPLTDK
jgi:hypothetical protein